MQAALKALLDPVSGARAAFPHLAALEEALGRRGTSAIDEVPLHWLARITTQLGSLPLRDDDLELQDLLSLLCKAIERRQMPPVEPPPADEDEPSNYLSDFHDSSRMEVREISHSAFIQEFEAQQLDTEPAPLADTPALR